mmetsp:Transcript_117687/g.340231  ORF Transcript_117687/g.340231 Transcript_117687/m.340231 type:complete len:220 (+) Transcript_117687:554-1213(+)
MGTTAARRSAAERPASVASGRPSTGPSAGRSASPGRTSTPWTRARGFARRWALGRPPSRLGCRSAAREKTRIARRARAARSLGCSATRRAGTSRSAGSRAPSARRWARATPLGSARSSACARPCSRHPATPIRAWCHGGSRGSARRSGRTAGTRGVARPSATSAICRTTRGRLAFPSATPALVGNVASLGRGVGASRSKAIRRSTAPPCSCPAATRARS